MTAPSHPTLSLADEGEGRRSICSGLSAGLRRQKLDGIGRRVRAPSAVAREQGDLLCGGVLGHDRESPQQAFRLARLAAACANTPSSKAVCSSATPLATGSIVTIAFLNAGVLDRGSDLRGTRTLASG